MNLAYLPKTRSPRTRITKRNHNFFFFGFFPYFSLPFIHSVKEQKFYRESRKLEKEEENGVGEGEVKDADRVPSAFKDPKKKFSGFVTRSSFYRKSSRDPRRGFKKRRKSVERERDLISGKIER